MRKNSISLFCAIFLILSLTGMAEALEGTIGTRFIINGSGFGTKKPIVYLEYETAPGRIKKVSAKVEAWNDTSLTCVWTKKMSPGTYNLYVRPKGLEPIPIGTFSIMNPVINKVTPATGSSGDVITLEGRFFSSKKPKVYLEDETTLKRKSCKVLSSSMDSFTGTSLLQFMIPKLSNDFGQYNLILKTLIGETRFARENFITVSGTVLPPLGTPVSSLTMVAHGETSPITSEGEFAASAYKDGVTVVAAMPPDKDFGLMNVVATSTASSSAGIQGETNIMSAYRDASSSLIGLNAKTTAVSMVFLTPYFLTNDPGEAEGIISIIENDPKVLILASVIENVFNENDPLANPTLQQALIDAVQSVLNTILAQATTPIPTTQSTSPKIFFLPKRSVAIEALAAPSPPYYADKDYITLKAVQTSAGYDLTAESKNGGSVDWIAEAMKINGLQFESLLDLQVKASDNRSLYQAEQSVVLGQLDASAKSYFRYFDLIDTALEWAFSAVFGNALQDRISLSATEDGIYLVRAYSGGWGKLVDAGEKGFVRSEVSNGSSMDTRSLSVNGFMVVFDTMSAFVAFDKLFPEEMNEVAKAGLEEAFSKMPSVAGNPDPNMRDLISVSADITKATLSKLTEMLIEEAGKNFLKAIFRVTEIVGKSAIDLATLNTAIKLGKPADRLLQLLVSTTPMETTIIVIGNPFLTVDIEKPSTPTNLTAVAISSSQIDLSWDQSFDNIGVAGYKVYRNSSFLKSVTSTSTSDIDLNAGTQYCYTVSAYDAAGNESGQSIQACAITHIPSDTTSPSIPTGLTASTVSSTRIDLSWNPSTDNVGVVGYTIYRNGSFLKSVVTTSTSDTALSPDTQYCYSVSAYDAVANESGQSGQVCAKTLSASYVSEITGFVVEQLPGELSSVNLSNGQVKLIAAGLNWPVDLVITSDRTTAYVTEQSGEVLSRINLSTGEITRFVPIPGYYHTGPMGVDLSSDDKNIYVTVEGGELYAINAVTGTMTLITSELNMPYDIKIEPTGTSALVTTCTFTGGADLVRVNLSTGKVTTIANLHPDSCAMGLDFEPGKNSVLVTIEAPGGLRRVNLETGNVTALPIQDTAFVFGYPHRIAVNSDGKTALVTLFGSHKLVSVDLSTSSVSTIIDTYSLLLTSPEGIELLP